MGWDLPVGVYLEDKTADGIKNIVNSLRGVSSAILSGAGTREALRNLFEYGDAIKKQRTFEILGGDLQKMNMWSEKSLTNIELMTIYTQLAARGVGMYQEQFVRAAARMKGLGLDPESLMRALAGGPPRSLRLFMNARDIEALTKAKTEVERITILTRALNAENLQAITGFHLLADNIKHFHTDILNFTQGPAYPFLKFLGLATASLIGLASGIKYFFGFSSLKNLLTLFKAFPVKGPLSFGIFAAGFYAKNLLTIFDKLMKLSADIFVFKGILKGLGWDIKSIIDLLPRFLGGLDIKNKKFILSPQAIKEIKDAGLTTFFQMTGKAILFFIEVGQTAAKVWEYIGTGIGKVLSVINPVLRFFNIISKDVSIGAGQLVGFGVAVYGLWMPFSALLSIGTKVNFMLSTLGPIVVGLDIALKSLMAIPLFTGLGIGSGVVALGLIINAVGGLDQALKNLTQTLSMLNANTAWQVITGQFEKGMGTRETGNRGFFFGPQQVAPGLGPANNPEQVSAISRQMVINQARARAGLPVQPIIIQNFIDGVKIDEVRNAQSRNQQAKTLGVGK